MYTQNTIFSQSGNRFLVDTNIFINAHRNYYSYDLVPSFWGFLEQQFSWGNLVSITPVREELKKGEDWLSDWAQDSNRDKYFRSINDAQTVQNLNDISAWVTSQNYTQAAMSEFFSIADYYLVAFAAAHGLVLLTHEQPRDNARKRVPIPNVCDAFNVEYRNTFEMMRDLGASF